MLEENVMASKHRQARRVAECADFDPSAEGVAPVPAETNGEERVQRRGLEELVLGLAADLGWPPHAMSYVRQSLVARGGAKAVSISLQLEVFEAMAARSGRLGAELVSRLDAAIAQHRGRAAELRRAGDEDGVAASLSRALVCDRCLAELQGCCEALTRISEGSRLILDHGGAGSGGGGDCGAGVLIGAADQPHRAADHGARVGRESLGRHRWQARGLRAYATTATFVIAWIF